MVEGQERVLFVGDDFQEGVAEERLVEGQLAAYLPQGFARSIDLRDEGAQQGDFRIEREAFAGDVVGLVVDDAAVRGRAARHKGQGCGEEVVVAPAPEFVAFDPCGAEREVGVVAADGLHQRRFLEFLFCVHGYWFEKQRLPDGLPDSLCRLLFPDERCRGRILAGQRQDEDGTCGEFRLGFVPDLREPQGLLGSELFRPSRQQEDARCGFDAGDRAFGREPCELSFAEAVPDFFGIGDQRERMAEARRSVRIQVLFPE